MLRYASFRGACRLISDGAAGGSLDPLGISDREWRTLTGDAPWLLSDRPGVSRSLTALVHGGMDAIGVARFSAPAEWLAAVVAMFVGPANVMAACVFVTDAFQAAASDQIINREAPDPVSPDELFALVCDAYSDDIIEFQRRFESRVNMKLERVVEPAPAAEPVAEPAAEKAAK